jgi:phosphoheptose isomerase
MSDFFPQNKFESGGDFAVAYFGQLQQALDKCDLSAFNEICTLFKETIKNDGLIFICGNGGSAAIANHSLCDFLKCVRTDTEMKPRVFSLSAHTELNSALSNDISYDDVFAYQLASMARAGDLLITISSSGNSENVVRAIEQAHSSGMRSVSFTGFEGGRSRIQADLNVHVDAHNYGVVEDTHMALIHVLTQYLRQSEMDAQLIAERKF